ncbi:MAG: MraY family glycosyltransferase [Pseudomonadota bacterium]
MTSILLMVLVMAAMVSSGILSANAWRVGTSLQVIDYPDITGGRKRHTNPTPLVGGIAFLLSMSLWGFLSIWLSNPVRSQGEDLIAISALMIVFALIGFIDDRQELSPKIRLVILLAATAFAVNNQPTLTVQFLHFEFFGKATILGNWGGIFTVLALVGLANAVNMADGKNGLVIGMCLVWNTVLLFFAAPILVPVLFISFGILLVLFYSNLRNRLFLGDTGSFALAAFFGLIAIYSYTQNFVRLPADVIVLMFMIPVLDCLRLMVSRVMRGQSPFSAGRDHLHHHIAAATGWGIGLPLYLSLIAVPLGLRFVLPDASFAIILLQIGAYVTVLAICSYSARLRLSGQAAL